MDSKEALMENENNSNLESESHLRDKDHVLTSEELVEIVGSNMSWDSSVEFAGLVSSNTSAATKSSTVIAVEGVTNNSYFEIERSSDVRPVEPEQLKDRINMDLLSDDKEESIQEYIDTNVPLTDGVIQSRASSIVGLNSASHKFTEAPNHTEPFISVSLEECNDTLVSHVKSLTESQTHETQRMDVDKHSETEQGLHVCTQIESKNTEKQVIPQSEISTETRSLGGASKFWDEEIDLLEYDSNDGSVNSGKNTVLISNGQDSTNKTDVESIKVGLPEEFVNIVDKQNITEDLNEEIIDKTVTYLDDPTNKNLNDTNKSVEVAGGSDVLVTEINSYNKAVGSEFVNSDKDQLSQELKMISVDPVAETKMSLVNSNFSHSSSDIVRHPAVCEAFNEIVILKEEDNKSTIKIVDNFKPLSSLEGTPSLSLIKLAAADTEMTQSSEHDGAAVPHEAVVASVKATENLLDSGDNSVCGSGKFTSKGPEVIENIQPDTKSSELTVDCDSETIETGRSGEFTEIHQSGQSNLARDIVEIKKEKVALSDDSSSAKVSQVSGGVKQEVNIEKAEDSEDDVVVFDDKGGVIPVKKEVPEASVATNGLDIQVSAVSGQQHQVHIENKQNSNTLSDAGNIDSSSRSKRAKSKMQTCIVCHKVSRCKYNIVRNGDVKHLCDDACFKKFRKRPGTFLTPADDSKTSCVLFEETSSKGGSSICSTDVDSRQDGHYKTCAVCQVMDVNAQQPFCNWKGLDFCGEVCLGKFQANLNTSCSFCHGLIPLDLRTNFCLKIGNDMRIFCKQKCHNDFKKNLRLCSFCQRDVSAVPGAFTALIGKVGKFKEFCSQDCLRKLESQNLEVTSVTTGTQPVISLCSVCQKQGTMKYTVQFQHKQYKLCSDVCLNAFQYTNKMNMGKCDSCGTICTTEEAQAHFIQYEGKAKRFCSDICVGTFRKTNSKVMPCGWCSTKKVNFDMIERLDADGMVQIFCSLKCLSLYRVNLQAKSNQAVSCDQCHKFVPAQYHLTMSDASVLNFCTYPCVITFQSQFTAKNIPAGASPALIQHHQPPAQVQQPNQQLNTMGLRGRGRPAKAQAISVQHSPTFPVITNVVSLASHAGDARSLNQQSLPVLAPSPEAPSGTGGMMASGDGKHQIIIQAAPPKNGKNKSMQCRPITQTKATSCRPHSQNKEVQTDQEPAKPVFIPIPVPIYIPMPTVMFTAPAPKLMPLPIPIPVPVFIPTTRKSVHGVFKTIQEIIERIPADPFEAELLMMAEAVAADKKPADDSDTDAEGGPEDEDIYSHGLGIDAQGVDMLLMMADEMSGPLEDLEASVKPVAVGTENSSPQQQPNIVHQPKAVHRKKIDDNEIDDNGDEDYTPPHSLRGRGGKRPRGRPPSSRTKRQRLEKSFNEDESSQQDSLFVQPQSEVLPSDADYHLKFTYGLNAWRHWVIGKNIQIEKCRSQGNTRARVFPTDILKCTTEELNLALCMFVNEVRKPSGVEYSADSIFYLCLGIQQYLYENSRIDSIFSDTYFEKFTDNLHEILKSFQPKVNKEGQMLCRIEEEHLWESKQLGAHSPFVLLNTLIYFHTKHFILKTVEEHMSLSFAQILKHWKKGVPAKGQTVSTIKNVSLRFYCLNNLKRDGASKKTKDGTPVYEVTENVDNPLRCPVKLYEFFLSKCPESIKNRNDIFYPVPERSCVPDSPVWYSTQSIDPHTLEKMLVRVLLVREIQEAHLHAQPIYL